MKKKTAAADGKFEQKQKKRKEKRRKWGGEDKGLLPGWFTD